MLNKSLLIFGSYLYCTAAVGAALCRDGLRSSPWVSAPPQILPGLLCSPVATQGRSYKDCEHTIQNGTLAYFPAHWRRN
ncbi:exported protein of unknown function [Pseudomonas inefficax]|uniref:Uncharacterized protein n=1 Tax=Pseudomonas inefficax TaxID=2078786 RepID=A0AAQ1SRB0_9PSED|nr:exported protein of unknown function [Pseudomonas inefficax]